MLKWIAPVLEYLVAATLPRLVPSTLFKERDNLLSGQCFHNATR